VFDGVVYSFFTARMMSMPDFASDSARLVQLGGKQSAADIGGLAKVLSDWQRKSINASIRSFSGLTVQTVSYNATTSSLVMPEICWKLSRVFGGRCRVRRRRLRARYESDAPQIVVDIACNAEAFAFEEVFFVYPLELFADPDADNPAAQKGESGGVE